MPKSIVSSLLLCRIGRYAIALAAVAAAWCAAAQDYVLTVRNIAELQAISANTLGTTNAVLVLGYYNPGDRGGGTFRWDSSSTKTPDGGRYLTGTGTGRWVRMLNGETANVRMWGAIAEYGNTADSTVAIQN